MDMLMNHELIQVQKPDLEILEVRLTELVAVMFQTIAKVKEQLAELEASLNNHASRSLA